MGELFFAKEHKCYIFALNTAYMIYNTTGAIAFKLLIMTHISCFVPIFVRSRPSVDPCIIHVIVHNLRSDRGTVVVSLFNNADGFPKMDRAYKVSTVKIVNRTAVAEFDTLPSGVYGIAVFHDENANGKMDTNFFGIPKEGVGASNGAKGHFGPPKFSDAAFRLDSKSKNIDITVTYL
jgi:uncharacterized protein (DUF2141 family)